MLVKIVVLVRVRHKFFHKKLLGFKMTGKFSRYMSYALFKQSKVQ